MKKNYKLFIFIFTVSAIFMAGCKISVEDNKTGNFNFTANVNSNVEQFCKIAEYSILENNQVIAKFNKLSVPYENDKFILDGISVDSLEEGSYKIIINFYADSNKQYSAYSFEKDFTITKGQTLSENFEISEDNKIDGINSGIFGKKDSNNPNTVFYVVNDTKLYVFGSGKIYESDYNAIPGITECFIDEGITEICSNAFYHFEMTKLSGGKDITTIQGDAFKDCVIKEIDGFNNITTMTKTTFGNSFSKFISLKGLNGITSIPENAFSGCSGLKEIDGFNGITSVGKQAFSSCTSLEKVNGFNSLETTGVQMFYKCSSLKTLTGFESLKTISDSTFNECSSLNIISTFSNVETIGNSAFLKCYSLSEINGFNSVITLGEHAFEYCTGIEVINGFNNLTSFGQGAFNECSGIKTIEGFNSLEETPVRAFSSTLVIETITGFANIKTINESIICTTVALRTFTTFNYNGTCNDFSNVVVPNWETRKKITGTIVCTDGRYTGTIKASN